MEAHLPAIFITDSPALNFLNSIATPVDVAVDWIGDGDGLLSWLQQAELVPARTLEIVRTQAMPGELDKVANQARSLREWFRSFLEKHRGKPLKADHLKELEQLNRLLERDEAFSQIALKKDRHTAFALEQMRRWRSPETLLLPIGEAIAQFVCTEDFSNIKACEGTTCTLLFADRTRGHARRWCSMAICGNRAKQSAHRKRFKED